MGAWNQSSRISALRFRLLPKYGVSWRESNEAFIETLIRFISSLPDTPERDAAHRFYILEDRQRKSEITGRPSKEDGRFYQHLRAFRFAFAVYLRETHGRAN